MENLQRELKLNFFLEMKRINTLYQIQILLVLRNIVKEGFFDDFQPLCFYVCLWSRRFYDFTSVFGLLRSNLQDLNKVWSI